jgi:hypothetical protein
MLRLRVPFVARLRFISVIAVLGAVTSPAAAQDPSTLRISTAVSPDTVTVGDHFRSVLRVEGEYEAIEFFPVPAGDTVQMVDTLRVTGGEAPTAVFTLAAWRTGGELETRVPIRVEYGDGSLATYLVRLRLPVVRSVLPADTAAHVPRPHRGLLDPPGTADRGWLRLLWLIPLVGLLAMLIAWLRRRREAGRPGETAREIALRELEGLRARGWLSADEYPRLYPAATRILREYLASVDPDRGTDLTSSELVRSLKRAGMEGQAAEIDRVLSHADAVKFARSRPSEGEIHEFWAEVERLVREVPAARAEHETPAEVAGR